MTTTPELATLAGKLSQAQRRVLVAAKPSANDARVFVPALVERKQWPHEVIASYSPGFRRLTETGLDLRNHLKDAR